MEAVAVVQQEWQAMCSGRTAQAQGWDDDAFDQPMEVVLAWNGDEPPLDPDLLERIAFEITQELKEQEHQLLVAQAEAQLTLEQQAIQHDVFMEVVAWPRKSRRRSRVKYEG